MNELESLRQKVRELEERLVQLEPPRPPKQYRDVTDEMAYREDGSCWGHHDKNTCVGWGGSKVLPPSYRLRKVKVEWFSGVPIGEAQQGVAFIIEKEA